MLALVAAVVLMQHLFSATKTAEDKTAIRKTKIIEAKKSLAQRHHLMMAGIDSGQYFLYSFRCKNCHATDSAHYANIDQNGVDINLYDDWQSSMMANSARDPFWRAKVSHEITVNPALALDIQDACLDCHAPQGKFTSQYHHNLHYTMNDLLNNDTLGLDGVACGGCHMIQDSGLGFRFSGDIPYDTLHEEFGPFQNPIQGPMQLYMGITPLFSTHMGEGKFCSPCHTLITHTVDLSGNPTGGTFVEQATFQEWKNSAAFQDNITCQQCHMPRLTDSVVIANGFLSLPPRAPFNLHKFMGGNAFMIQMIKDNKVALGAYDIPDANFDSTLSATFQNLKLNTLDLNVLLDSVTVDTVFITVKLHNRAGHKFPSGYPSRRGVLQFVVTNQIGDTIFQSGTFDSNYEVHGAAPPFQPHYQIINQQNQSQIYELVMGDVLGNKTTVLARADTALKDNRLVPEGFFASFSGYDTIPIVGGAENDPDFNHSITGAEGTGTDRVHYHIPITGFSGDLHVNSTMYFQSVPPAWLTEMFSNSTPLIDTFRNMYNAADKSPVAMVNDTLLISNLEISKINSASLFSVSPDPTMDGRIKITSLNSTLIDLIDVYDAEGKFQFSISPDKNATEVNMNLPQTAGTYFLHIQSLHRRFVVKVLHL